jgi:hypothetical protein
MRCLVVGTRNAGNAGKRWFGLVVHEGVHARCRQNNPHASACGVRTFIERYCTRKGHNTQSGVVNNRAHCRGVSGGERDGHGLHEGWVRAVHVRRVRSENRRERYRRVSVDKTSRFTNARRHTSTHGRGEV